GSGGGWSEALCDPPYRPTGGNASRNLFALLKPQRSQSPPAWRWSNPSIASQDPIDAALVPPLKRSRDVRHTLTALPALPQLSLLFRREPCPVVPLHSHTSSAARIRRCCFDSLNAPGIRDAGNHAVNCHSARIGLRTLGVKRHQWKSHDPCRLIYDQSGSQQQKTWCTVADREIAETPIASRSGPGAGHPYRLADRLCL